MPETYLDSTTSDNLLEIDGYNLVRADHPDNIKRGGVCIYYKELFTPCSSYKFTIFERRSRLRNE